LTYGRAMRAKDHEGVMYLSAITKLGSIDRRWIYALSALVILVPLVRPLGLPIAVSPETDQAYAVLEKLGAGARVLVTFDFQPGNIAQMGPLGKVLLQILSDMGVKVVTCCSFPDSATFPETFTKQTFGAQGKEYGVDYVNLGYYAGSEATFTALCDNIRDVFKTDFRGNSLESLPLMSGLSGVEDFDLVVAVNSTSGGAGTNVEMMVRQVNIAHKKDLLVATSTVSAPQNMVFLQSKNIVGLLAGVNGAAELEALTGKPGAAIASMDALTAGHLLVIVFLVLGNIGYLYERRQKQGGAGK
jgi:hypothetical protein